MRRTLFELPDGIPSMDSYTTLLKSPAFKRIERYSDNFVSSNQEILESYNRRWVGDPLHQWSRQWEYPYIINSLTDYARKNKEISILDLGSGITFLPYYAQEEVGINEVKALDYDQELPGLFEDVNKLRKSSIKFIKADIRKLGILKKETFDFIYCVSVLEHTDNYKAIVKNCHRLLKPGGRFCITFDISLDGVDDIPLDAAKHLLSSIEKVFMSDDLVGYASNIQEEIVTSAKIAKIDKSLMPWKYPVLNIIKPLVKFKRPGRIYKKLTFCCITVDK